MTSKVPLVWLAQSAFAAMSEESSRHHPRESGGLLLGYRVSEDEAIVSRVLGPGPRAEHRSNGFRPDTAYQDRELERAFEDSRGVTTYLGDWHSHPGQPGIPSSKDRRTLRRIARTKEASCPLPLMIIVGEDVDHWVVEGWQGRLGLVTRLHVHPVALRVWDFED